MVIVKKRVLLFLKLERNFFFNFLKIEIIIFF